MVHWKAKVLKMQHFTDPGEWLIIFAIKMFRLKLQRPFAMVYNFLSFQSFFYFSCYRNNYLEAIPDQNTSNTLMVMDYISSKLFLGLK